MKYRHDFIWYSFRKTGNMDCVHNRLLTCLLTLDRPLICFWEIKKEILEAHFLKENKYIKHMGAKINVQVATTGQLWFRLGR